MGFRVCYMASQLSPAEMALALNLRIAGAETEMPDDDWWIARFISSGWTVLWCEDEEFAERSHAQVMDLSRKTDVIQCRVNETVMWSSVEFCSKSKTLWSVSHFGENGDMYDLSSEGALPQIFEGIKTRHFEEQKLELEEDGACDVVFDIPVELFKSYTGFRYGDVPDSSDVDAFHIVEMSGRRSLISRLFGR